LVKIGALEDTQVALHLLRQCASFCKVGYSIRVVPPSLHREALATMDISIKSCAEQVVGCILEEPSWKQAQLALATGGVGLRSCARHAAAGFIASRATCGTLCSGMYPPFNDDNPSGVLASAVQSFNSEIPESLRLRSADDLRQNQKALSNRIEQSCRSELLDQASTRTKAHLELVSAKGSSGWIQAPPCPAIGTDFPSSLMQVSLQRRLGVRLSDREVFCPACGEVMDAFGDHALVCSCKGDRVRRHNKLRNQSFFDLQAAGFAPELEKPGLLPCRMQFEGPPDGESGGSELDPSGRRPADVYVPRWRAGYPAAWDFAVTSGLRSDLLSASVADGGEAATRYETTKRNYLNTARLCSDAGFSFIPMVVEAHGGSWGSEARRAFAVLAKRVADSTGEDASLVADRHAQRLSVLLHKENARAVLQRMQSPIGGSNARLSASAAAHTTLS
jgi:hypothetical protein